MSNIFFARDGKERKKGETRPRDAAIPKTPQCDFMLPATPTRNIPTQLAYHPVQGIVSDGRSTFGEAIGACFGYG